MRLTPQQVSALHVCAVWGPIAPNDNHGIGRRTLHSLEAKRLICGNPDGTRWSATSAGHAEDARREPVDA